MMEAEIYAIRKALKLLDHENDSTRERAFAAERAVDAIETVLKPLDDEEQKELRRRLETGWRREA